MTCKNISIGKKIGLGFAIVLVMLSAVGFISYSGVNGIIRNARGVIDGNKLDALLAQKEVDHMNWVSRVTALFTDRTAIKLEVETDDHKCAFGKWLYGEERKQAEKSLPSLVPILKEIEDSHRKLHESAVEIGKHFHQADLTLGNFLREKKTDHLAWTHKVKDALLDSSATSVEVEMDPTKCSLGKWMHSKEVEDLKQKDPTFGALFAQLEEPHRKLHESAREIGKSLADGKHEEARLYYAQNTNKLAAEVLASIDKMITWHDAQYEGKQEAKLIYETATAPALQKTRKLLNQARDEAKKNIITDQGMLDAALITKRSVGLIVGIALLFGISISFLIGRGICKCLRALSEQMNEAAEQVASASGQVASASQQLADGASHQAASIEETSSSLEEISSMTRQNAANADQANLLMSETREIVTLASKSMRELTTSMADITKASEETSRIIKTIDEIAFQTNLLALNAAVEAARAGDAGAGFAVVADEVRNLAMRAAEAAKSTASLIEGTVKKIKEGSELVEKTDKEFEDVALSVTKSGDLVGEISAASSEQTQGIEQVNQAVGQMDKIVQQNASTAEESAAASEEMNSMAFRLRESVLELLEMVNGSTKETKGAGLDTGERGLKKRIVNVHEEKSFGKDWHSSRPDLGN